MTINAERFAKICARFTSSFDDEKLAALRLATEALKREGLTWQAFVTQAFRSPSEARGGLDAARRTEARAEGRSFATRKKMHRGVLAHDLVRALDRCRPRLSDWECSFVDSLPPMGRTMALTDRQWFCLWGIGEKAGLLRNAPEEAF